jgi:hypothetical protein
VPKSFGASVQSHELQFLSSIGFDLYRFVADNVMPEVAAELRARFRAVLVDGNDAGLRLAPAHARKEA